MELTDRESLVRILYEYVEQLESGSDATEQETAPVSVKCLWAEKRNNW